MIRRIWDPISNGRIWIVGLWMFSLAVTVADDDFQRFNQRYEQAIGADNREDCLLKLKDIIQNYPQYYFPYVSFTGLLPGGTDLISVKSELGIYFEPSSFAYKFIFGNFLFGIRYFDLAVHEIETIEKIPFNFFLLQRLIEINKDGLEKFIKKLDANQDDQQKVLTLFLAAIFEKGELPFQVVANEMNYLDQLHNFENIAFIYDKYGYFQNRSHEFQACYETLEEMNHLLEQEGCQYLHANFDVYVAVTLKMLHRLYKPIRLTLEGRSIARKFHFNNFFEDYDFVFISLMGEMDEQAWVEHLVSDSKSYYLKTKNFQALFRVLNETGKLFSGMNQDLKAYQYYFDAFYYIEFGLPKDQFENLAGLTLKGSFPLLPGMVNPFFFKWESLLGKTPPSAERIYYTILLGDYSQKNGHIKKADGFYSEACKLYLDHKASLQNSFSMLYDRKLRERIVSAFERTGQYDAGIQIAKDLSQIEMEREDRKHEMNHRFDIFDLSFKKEQSVVSRFIQTVTKFPSLKKARESGLKQMSKEQLDFLYFNKEKASFFKDFERIENTYSKTVRTLTIAFFLSLGCVLAILYLSVVFIRRHLENSKRIIGPYRYLSVIGEGGMGLVYHAVSLDRPRREVALKVFKREGLEDSYAQDRFIHEWILLQKLNHGNILKMLDYGRHNQQLFFATEFVNGNPLDHIISGHWPLPLDRAMNIVIGILDGLVYLHEKEIFHRDLKPSNIMLKGSDWQNIDAVDLRKRVKIMDFGLALDPTQTRLTETDGVLGTPSYIPPEMLITGMTDARSDIYSLGIMLYELFTGSVPFSHPESGILINQLLQTTPTKPSTVYHKVPLELDDLIMKCIEKQPFNRYSSMKELRHGFMELFQKLWGS